MIDWIVKKVICSRVNDLLKRYNGNVEKFRTTLKSWLWRIQKVTACLESLLAKLDDGEINSDEVKQATDEVSELIKEW